MSTQTHAFKDMKSEFLADPKGKAAYDSLAPEYAVASAMTVRRHIKWHRFRPGLRETLLTSLVDIKRRLCGIASVDVRLSYS